jgi:large subunit ribosomal protein L25
MELLAMSVTFELKAEPRGDLGKGASRRLRRAGKVPAILYGGGQEPQPLVLSHLDILNQLKNEAVYSHVLTLNLGDRTESVVLRDLQRHPFKPTILHLDFLRVSADRKLRVHIPLHFVNEETSRGVKQQGGVASRSLIDIEVTCLPNDLPEFIEVDLIDLGMGEVLHLSQIPLPTGVELADKIIPGSDQDVVVVSIHHAHGGDEGSGATPAAPGA